MSIRSSGRSVALMLAIAGTVGVVGASHANQYPRAAALWVDGAPVSVAAPVTDESATIPVVVRLTDKPLAAVAGNKRTGMKMTAAQQRSYAAKLRQKQDSVMSAAEGLGGQKLAGLVNASNALVMEIPANQAVALRQIAGVAAVMPLGEYKLDLTQTVPYVGATALQTAGLDGTGVRVAVFDSGIDFMHRNLGGTGLVADFTACYAQANVAPSGICADYFGPGAPKVIGGYDFVGESWPNAAVAPDPNPIARAGTGGHGTNVSDIILGKSADGTHVGVAPGAKLYAVKVCSAVASSCNGVAILQGFDFSLDPNGDGDLSDAVDVINLSLGANYGQRENGSVLAANEASRFGVVVVASAGNGSNRPFITGSPSSATSVIAVAQTNVPGATVTPLVVNKPASIAGTYANTNTVSWAPVGTGFENKDVVATSPSPSAPLANDGCTGAPMPAAVSGNVALIRRGTCAISEKVKNATNAGAVGVLLDNNAAGDPPTFSQGPETAPFAPTLILTQADGNTLRGRLAAGDTVNASTGAAISLAGGMVTTSSRGPVMQTGMSKPDIGAPGASVSALVGSGTGQSVFGGTSGAAPMVAGGAALLLQAYPNAQPHEIKARLMNAAETDVFTTHLNKADKAPVSRIGGGELRVDRSHGLSTAAWDASDPGAVSLSMGVTRNIGTQTLRKRVLVRNYSNVARTYSISRSFRDAGDAATGAVALSLPGTITVPANGSATFTVTATVNATKLPVWETTGVNGGVNGGNGALIDLPEYDGYINIKSGGETVRVPWHVFPHRAANVTAPASLAMGGAASAPLTLSNVGGAVGGRTEVFYLTGTSPQIPNTALPAEGDSRAVIDLKAVGVRLVQIGGTAAEPQWGVQFAINTYGQRSHPNYPAGFQVFIDADNNGTDDFVVFTTENGGFGASGQNLVALRKNLPGCTTGSAFFFADADLSSANSTLTIPMVANLPSTGACAAGPPGISLSPGQTFRFRVVATDNYFTGAITDQTLPMQVNLNAPRFVPAAFTVSVPPGVTAPLGVTYDPAGEVGSPSQTGLLLMYRDGRFGSEASAVTVTP